jgi:uncharacterized protein
VAAGVCYHGLGALAITPIEVQSHIGEMVRRIVEGFAPDNVILFGSHARGDASPDSDVDLLVIGPIHGSKRDLRIRIRVALQDMPVAKDIFVATSDEIRRLEGIPGTLIYPALREGRTLYERVN